MTKILIVGGGGREHAIAYKLKKDGVQLYCAPGNGGISQLAECVDIKPNEVEKMVLWAKENAIDLVFVAPDDPLALGMVDALQKAEIRAFGPSKAAAEIEWSKAYSKWLMKKYDIPTANFEVFDNAQKAVSYLQTSKYPVVVKADGLALGKGVIICENFAQAKLAVNDVMIDKKFGNAGAQIVIEEFISGPEVSVLAFCDGKTILPMLSAQDHKRAYDNDKGLNTGGMGTFTPSPKYTLEIQQYVEKEIFAKTVAALNAEGRTFQGVIFFGLMLTQDGPKLLEYNARLGDPETQSVFLLLKTDLLKVIDAVIDGTLDKITLEWEDKSAVCVVLASGGYPQKYENGKKIVGLDQVDKDVVVFHAGTKIDNGTLVTNGGRVLGVTATGKDIAQAREKAYANVKKIHFDGAQFRTDIGIK
ncbi:MAG: phosphoribosylamine--glycine ligase [Christensenellaceae bacterium]